MSASHDVIARSHELDGTPHALSRYYEDWAPQYETDVENAEYRGPETVSALFAHTVANYLRGRERLTVLDAGCGTGLVGRLLTQKVSGVTLDGSDLSHAMIAEAAKAKVYRLLSGGVDLNLGLREFPENGYDATISCGVFTLGHVQPQAIEGLLRVTRPGGFVIVSARQRYLTETDFEMRLKTLANDGRIEVFGHHVGQPYVVDETADYWVLGVR